MWLQQAEGVGKLRKNRPTPRILSWKECYGYIGT